MVKSGTGREGGAVSVPAAVLFRRGKEAWNGASRDGRPPERGEEAACGRIKGLWTGRDSYKMFSGFLMTSSPSSSPSRPAFAHQLGMKGFLIMEGLLKIKESIQPALARISHCARKIRKTRSLALTTRRRSLFWRARYAF
jgi:hypothetical protein